MKEIHKIINNNLKKLRKPKNIKPFDVEVLQSVISGLQCFFFFKFPFFLNVLFAKNNGTICNLQDFFFKKKQVCTVLLIPLRSRVSVSFSFFFLLFCVFILFFIMTELHAFFITHAS